MASRKYKNHIIYGQNEEEFEYAKKLIDNNVETLVEFNEGPKKMEEKKIVIVEHVHKNEGLLQDSLEIGTPSKGGAIKLYVDFGKPELTKKKIDEAIKQRKYLQDEAEK